MTITAKPLKRIGPGRPVGESLSRETLLDAAEASFAERGYTGTSLREIVKRANVTQGLIKYYFGSKEALFKEVFLRRGLDITAKRLEALDALERRKEPPTLTELTAAYLGPALAMRRSRKGRIFIRLQARLHTEPPKFADSLRRQVYDEATRRYVEAIRRAAPHLSEKTVYWRMVQVIGAYLYAHSDAHRLEELSEGACDPDDSAEMLRQLTGFVVGGLMAPDD